MDTMRYIRDQGIMATWMLGIEDYASIQSAPDAYLAEVDMMACRDEELLMMVAYYTGFSAAHDRAVTGQPIPPAKYTLQRVEYVYAEAQKARARKERLQDELEKTWTKLLGW